MTERSPEYMRMSSKERWEVKKVQTGTSFLLPALVDTHYFDKCQS